MKKCKSIIVLLSICFLIFGNGYIAQATESIIPENEAMGNDAATVEDISESSQEETVIDDESRIETDVADEEVSEDETATAEGETSADVLGDHYLSYADTCISADDTKTYSFTIDFSTTPEVKAAIVRTGDGNVKASIKDENGNQVKSFYCNAKDEKTVITPRQWGTLSKPEGASDVCTFTAVVSTDTNSSFCFSVGSNNDLPSMLSGEDKKTPIDKYGGFEQAGYTNCAMVKNYIPAENLADYYTYVGTDRNIIEMYSMGSTGDDNMAFEVIETDTNTSIFRSAKRDSTVEKISDTINGYHVRYDGKDIVSGTEYIIKVYSRNGVSFAKNYSLYVGNPMFKPGYKSSVSATSYGTITTTRDELFTFNVTGVPRDAYATRIYFSPGKTMYRGAYRVVATNGKTYYAKEAGNGIYKDYIDIPFDAINYDGGGNASVNGTWKIWLRSPGGSYSIKPKISVEYKYMSGVEDIY